MDALEYLSLPYLYLCQKHHLKLAQPVIFPSLAAKFPAESVEWSPAFDPKAILAPQELLFAVVPVLWLSAHWNGQGIHN